MPIGIVSKSWLKSLVGNDSEESNGQARDESSEIEPGNEELAAMSNSEEQNVEEIAEDKAEESANDSSADEGAEASEKGKPFRLGDSKAESKKGAEDTETEDDSEADSDENEPEAVTEGEEDPLAPGYCLEDGELMDEGDIEEPTALPWQSRVTSAKDFFNTELLYRYDILEENIRKRVLGTYRIELRGFKGGVWTLELGDDLNVTNRKEDAECVLAMQQKDFIHLVNGELNPQIAILAQKVKVTGDVKRALALQELLAPASE